MNSLLIERGQVEVGLLPKDITGAAQTGAWVSLKGHQRLTIIISQGAWAGGTPAVTLEQATAVAGTGNKALAFDTRYTRVAGAASTWVKTAVTSNTFNLPATADTMNVIEIDADSLDTNGDFDCVTVKIATPGANADLLSVLYVLTGARYPQAIVSDATAD